MRLRRHSYGICRKSGNAHQHEQTRQRAEIVDFKEWIEVDAEREEQERERNPQKSKVSQPGEEERKRNIQRREKKESVESHAIFQPLQIRPDGLRAAGAKRRLHLVLKLLLAREFQMRLRIGLPGERGGNAVLIAAQHVRERGPTAGHLFVLKQGEPDGRKQHQGCGDRGFRAAIAKLGNKNSSTLAIRKTVSYGRVSQCKPIPSPSSAPIARPGSQRAVAGARQRPGIRLPPRSDPPQ